MIARTPAIRLLVLGLLAHAALLLHSLGAAPRATLSTKNAAVGEAVEYEVTVEGSFDVSTAPAPAVDGLTVQGISHRTQLLIYNFSPTRRTEVTYTLVAERQGTFTIPPLELVVDGRRVKTNSLTLVVGPAPAAQQEGDFAFGEIRLKKKTAYVGEAVPAEVRLYLEDETVRWEFQQQQSLLLNGNGFTTQPLGRPKQRTIAMAGKRYVQVTFQTVVTPSKAGKLTIGPFPAKMAYSKALQNRFGFAPRLGPPQALQITAREVELDVLALPTNGRPATFAGAIGKFKFEAVGTPNRVNVGEPVEMTLTISGEGNFDRIKAPPIPDDNGWRIYDAEQRFEPAEEVGVSGTKTFTIPVAPTTAKTSMPVFAFTYFDPESAKYQTLTNQPAALAVTGAAPSVARAPQPSKSASSATPAPVGEPRDILGILPQVGPAWNSGPAFSSKILLALFAAPAPILALLVAWRTRRADPHAARRQTLRREKANLLARVRNASDRSEVFDAAVRVLQIHAALGNGKEPHACELPDIVAVRNLTPDATTAVQQLLAARADLIYAGGVRDGDALSATERDRVLETLATYERSPAR